MKTIISSFRASFTLLLLLTLLLGVAYPLVVMGIAQTFFHHRAEGSLIERGDRVLGSSLLGQEFTSAKYFWGRLSATTPPYNASASGASNFSADNSKLMEAVNARVNVLHQADPGNKARIPVDLVTASGSGLDPHISRAAADYQTARVARARGIPEAQVKAMVDKYTEKPGFGLLAAPYVNVVRLNLALDEK